MIKVIFLTLLLSGCGNVVKPPEVVKVAVTVPCVKEPRPVRPVQEFGASVGPFPCDGKVTKEERAKCSQEVVSAAIREFNRLQKYADELETALAGCVSIKGD